MSMSGSVTPGGNAKIQSNSGGLSASKVQASTIKLSTSSTDQKKNEENNTLTQDQKNALAYSSPGSSRMDSTNVAKAVGKNFAASTPLFGNNNKPFAPLNSQGMFAGLDSIGKGAGQAMEAMMKAMQQKKAGKDGGEQASSKQEQQKPPPPPPPQQGKFG